MPYEYMIWGLAAVVVVLGLIAAAFMRRKDFKRPDQLQTLGATMVVLGIIFGVEDLLIGYSFIGVGVLVSVASLVVRRRQAKP